MDSKTLDYDKIIALLRQQSCNGFSAYHKYFIKRIIDIAMANKGIKDYGEYLLYIQKNNYEYISLKKQLYISYSRFFRNTLTFEYFDAQILKNIKQQKTENNPLRIWSAGCASGEEPYSIAILLDKFNEDNKHPFYLVATDIDEQALNYAKIGDYDEAVLPNVKLCQLKKYFTKSEKGYRIVEKIQSQVHFSAFDLRNKRCFVPPECVFGDFDIVFCRNVLIYFTPEHQDEVISKLHKALVTGGYLILGKKERLSGAMSALFKKVIDFCPVYVKI